MKGLVLAVSACVIGGVCFGAGYVTGEAEGMKAGREAAQRWRPAPTATRTADESPKEMRPPPSFAYQAAPAIDTRPDEVRLVDPFGLTNMRDPESIEKGAAALHAYVLWKCRQEHELPGPQDDCSHRMVGQIAVTTAFNAQRLYRER